MDVSMNISPPFAASLFGLSFEEEKMRNLKILVEEASSLPHAMILFDHLEKETLFFSVLIACSHPLTLARMESLDPLMTWVPERVRWYRSIAAQMCVVSMPMVPFLQKGRIHFPKARKRIVQVLQKGVGKFRDYNGGFLEKREELLEEVRKNLSEPPWIIEELFYSLAPASCQVTLPSALLQRFFQKCLEHLSSRGSMEIQEEETFTFVHWVHRRPDFLFSMRKTLYEMDWIYTHVEVKGKTHLFCLVWNPL